MTYDNTDSGLTATNVQDAIDEVDNAVDGLSDDAKISQKVYEFTDLEKIGLSTESTFVDLVNKAHNLGHGAEINVWINQNSTFGQEVRQAISDSYGLNVYGWLVLKGLCNMSGQNNDGVECTFYRYIASDNDQSFKFRRIGSYINSNILRLSRWIKDDHAKEGFTVTAATGITVINQTCYRIGNKVHIEAQCRNTDGNITSATPLFTIPAGYRPFSTINNEGLFSEYGYFHSNAFDGIWPRGCHVDSSSGAVYQRITSSIPQSTGTMMYMQIYLEYEQV